MKIDFFTDKLSTKLILSILSGLLLALSWPTYGFYPLIFVAFVPIFILLFNHQIKKKFIFIYIAFFLWNYIATNWLKFASSGGMWFAVLANSLLMTFTALASAKISKILNRKNLEALIFICFWIGFEKAHYHWDLSWPWLTLGNIFANSVELIQWYEFTGVFGGSLWILIINFLVFNLINSKSRKKTYYFLSGCILIPIIISIIILKTYKTDSYKEIEALIVQPNVDPYTEKFNQKNIEVCNDLINQVKKHISNETELIVAPETVFAEFVEEILFDHTKPKKLINEQILTSENISLLAGIDSYKFFTVFNKTKNSRKVNDKNWIESYNSSFLATKNNDNQYYHKSKLVVGVENFPFKTILDPLIGEMMINLGGSTSSRTIQESQIPFKTKTNDFIAPIICYESVYGEHISEFVRNKANLLAIITNDGWWNTSQGHKQHLAYARLRAIESRKYIVRSANTGISAFINDLGYIYQQSKYNEKIVLKDRVKLNKSITFYNKYGDLLGRLSIFMSIIFVLMVMKKNMLSSSKKDNSR